MRRFVVAATFLLVLSTFLPAFAQTCTSPSGVPVTMCSPVNGSTVNSPVHELVATNDPGHTISAIYTYVDNVVVRKDFTPSVDAFVTIAAGAHNIRVQVWDNAGNLFKAGSNITVVSGITVSVSPSSASVASGGTQQFQATVSGTSNTAVTWSVDGVAGGNSTVGAISTSGLYTAPGGAGSHTVTATSAADSSKSGSASVTVTSTSGGGGACTSPSGVPVTMCTPVNGSTVTSPVHETVATNDPGHAISAIFTYVDNVNVRKDYTPSVDALVPIASGAHNIRVQVWDNAGNLFQAGSNITVSGSTSGVSVAVSPTSASLQTGATQQFQATVSGSSNTAVTWSVDGITGGNSTVGTVSTTGLYTAPGAAGSHSVTATSAADTTKSANASVTVTAASGGGSCTSPSGVPVTMCSPVNGSTVSSPVHELVATNDPGHTISAIYTYVDNVNVRKDFTSSVDALVTIAAGAHNIRVQVWDNAGNLFQAGSNITVAAGVTVAISPTSASVQVDKTQQFNATVSGSSNTGVTWSVDGMAGGNTSVGTVDNTGLYTAPSAAGNHSVTATSVADTTRSASAAVSVVTQQVSNFPGMFKYHGDNYVSGLNSMETVLTPSNVNATQFGKLFTRALDGYVFAQPLYVPNVNIPNQGTFNVVYVATEHDSVYAYDADGKVTTPLWHRSFINGTSVVTIPGADVNNYDEGPEVGITSTPVIDPSTNTMYVVAATKEGTAYFQRLHALDIATGADKMTPVAISGSVSGTGKGSVNGVVTFDPKIENQRSALLLANGYIYIGFASHGDQGNYHGWLFAYNASSLAQVAGLNLTPNDWAGGIWSAGAGLASDSSGNIYTVTGNGRFDLSSGGKDAGDSYLKFNSSLGLLDYFTPYNQSTLNSGDLDVGAAGVLLVPDDQVNTTHVHVMLGSNKNGDLYVMDRDSMGHYQTSSNNNIIQYLPRAVGANSSGDQYFGVPAYWNGNVYIAGAYDSLKQFSLSAGLLSVSPIAKSPETVAQARSARPVVSSNGNSNAIVWVISTDSGASTPTLRAYDATNVNHELYNTKQNATRDTPTGGVLKFNSPTIANGKVFLPAQKNLNVYGLLNP